MKAKEREDGKRNARPSNIEKGDLVLMRNLHPQNKLSTDFLQEKFQVDERNGSDVRVKSLNTGKSYNRNVSHLKKLPVDNEDSRASKSNPIQELPRSERVRNRPKVMRL